jgi:hypothetical protein
MRPVAGRGLKIEGHIRLRINDLGGGRYLDTPSDRSFDASHDPHPGVQETGCDTGGAKPTGAVNLLIPLLPRVPSGDPAHLSGAPRECDCAVSTYSAAIL